jgi:hypothetical protein
MNTRIERARHADLERVVDQASPPDDGGAAARLVTTTTVGVYPTTAGSFFAGNPTEIDGTETEGGSATYTTDGAQIMYGLNVGTAIPSNGTRLVWHAVGGRWTFRYDG